MSQIVYGLQVITVPTSLYGLDLKQVLAILLPSVGIDSVTASINGIPVDICGNHPIYDRATIVLAANKLHTLG